RRRGTHPMSINLPRLVRAAVVAVLSDTTALSAADKKPADKKPADKKAAAKRTAVGKTAKGPQFLYKTGKTWKLTKAGQELYAGQTLVAGYGPSLENAKGTVRVNYLGDLNGTSP